MTARPAGEALLHPAALGAIALLVLNDHLLKRAMGGWITGKLSDLAGLAFFPLLLQGASLLVLRAGGRASVATRGSLAACCLLTAFVFALVKTWSPAHEGYRLAMECLQWPIRQAAAFWTGGGWLPLVPVASVMDPGDLLALPATLVAWRVGVADLAAERSVAHAPPVALSSPLTGGVRCRECANVPTPAGSRLPVAPPSRPGPPARPDLRPQG